MRLSVIIIAAAFCWSAGSTIARAASDPLDAPPPSLTTSTAVLSQILAQHDKAVGSIAAGSKDTAIEHWTFTDSGLEGTEVLERSGTNYHSRIARGPFVESYGQIDGKRWHTDSNGFTTSSSGFEYASFYAERVLEDAADPKSDVTVAGETTAASPAYVLRVKKSGDDHPEWIFYDKSSGQIVRVEFVLGRRRQVETYDDFRVTSGLSQAWHVHDTDGRPELDDDWHLVSLERGVPIAATQFAQPANDVSDDHVSGRAIVPAQFLDSQRVLVRIVVNGRGLDFELDPSEHYSAIERGVAAELGLPTFGQVTHLRDGKPVRYQTVIADADIGPAHLHDFKVDAVEYTYRAQTQTQVVGWLGYDFLANHVVHIDYVNKMVEIIKSGDFGMDKPIDGGLELPASFDDGVLLVPMQFGNAYTDRVALGNAYEFTIVMGPFYTEHLSDFDDRYRKEAAGKNAPFADTEQNGGPRWWPTDTGSLRFAIADFGPQKILATEYPWNYRQTKIDAMIGMDLLRYFDLYFDYPHARFFVKPNAWFNKYFSKETKSVP